MDKTKEFILQCEKAVEIQKIHDFEGVAGIIGISYSENNVYFGKEIAYNALKIIWLPRQDQLQGMIKDNYKNAHTLSFAFQQFTLSL